MTWTSCPQACITGDPSVGGVLAGVGQAGLLLDGEGVHVGAEQDGGARRRAEDADHAGSADALVHVAADLVQTLDHLLRGPVLLVRKLGMGMQVAVGLLLPAPDSGKRVEDGSGSALVVMRSIMRLARCREGPGR